MTPIKIEREDLYAYFQGSHGRYETFLDNCPCGDFIRSKLPCKHIYRLAIELGLLNEEVQTNTNAIPTPKKEQATLDEMINIIESLPEKTQKALENITGNINATYPAYLTEANEDVKKLMEAGIVIDYKPEEHRINWQKREKIIELLEEEHIEYKKSDKVGVLKEICLEKIKEKVKEKFGEQIYVSVSTQYSPYKIHLYLERKFYGNDIYEENNGIMKKTNTEIMEQLIKRGYYTRK